MRTEWLTKGVLAVRHDRAGAKPARLPLLLALGLLLAKAGALAEGVVGRRRKLLLLALGAVLRCRRVCRSGGGGRLLLQELRRGLLPWRLRLHEIERRQVLQTFESFTI